MLRYIASIVDPLLAMPWWEYLSVLLDFVESFLMFFEPNEILFLFQLYQRGKDSSLSWQIQNEPSKEINFSKERLQLLLAQWGWCFDNGFGLILIDCNPFLCTMKPKKLLAATPKAHFSGFIFKPCFFFFSNSFRKWLRWVSFLSEFTTTSSI